jgi:hypothetical protein
MPTVTPSGHARLAKPRSMVYAAFLFFLQPVGINAGERLDKELLPWSIWPAVPRMTLFRAAPPAAPVCCGEAEELIPVTPDKIGKSFQHAETEVLAFFGMELRCHHMVFPTIEVNGIPYSVVPAMMSGFSGTT